MREQQKQELNWAFDHMHPEDRELLLEIAKMRAAQFIQSAPKLSLVVSDLRPAHLVPLRSSLSSIHNESPAAPVGLLEQC